MQSRTRLSHLLWVSLLLFVLIVSGLSLAAAQEEPCYGDPECYGEPSEPSSESSGDWSGFADGRLNPAMDEYYAVWCMEDALHVWGGKPNPALIDSVPLSRIVALGGGGSFSTTTGLLITVAGDTATILGSNGNDAPNPGSKSFSLSTCFERNGGAPEAEVRQLTINPPPPNTTVDPNDPLAECADAPYDLIYRCVTSKLLGTAPTDTASSLQWLWINLLALINGGCPGVCGMVFVLPSGFVARRLFKRRQRTTK